MCQDSESQPKRKSTFGLSPLVLDVNRLDVTQGTRVFNAELCAGANKPLCIDLFCGLGGWAEGFLAEGWDVIGFDIERHRYWMPETPDGDGSKGTRPVEKCAVSLGLEGATAKPRTRLAEYPAQLVLQDVLTLNGSQFRNADCIVASPPCQAYSYRAMPWKRAKALPPPSNELFDACFRIQREACEAAGRHIPMVVENVKGAQPFVGRARWHYGSFYLWGDVPALMPKAMELKGVGSTWFGIQNNGVRHDQRACNPTRVGVKQPGHSGRAWFADPDVAGHFPSKSPARKAASAAIAKIPFELASYIAKVYRPEICSPATPHGRASRYTESTKPSGKVPERTGRGDLPKDPVAARSTSPKRSLQRA